MLKIVTPVAERLVLLIIAGISTQEFSVNDILQPIGKMVYIFELITFVYLHSIIVTNILRKPDPIH